jgi:hypothetical protein
MVQRASVLSVALLLSCLVMSPRARTSVTRGPVDQIGLRLQSDAKPSATPGPASLFLLGSGVLGLIGATRRRLSSN